MKIKVELDNKVIESLRNDIKAYRQQLKEQVFQALTVLEAAILQNIRKNSGLKVLTGRLLNSIGKSKLVKDSNGSVVTGEIGPKGVPYAAIHEYGGTIVPIKAKMLTIPFPENRRKDGTPKITAQEAMRSGRGFFRNGVLFQKEIGGSGRITPLFALKKSVTIPARPYLAPAVSQTQSTLLKNFGMFLTASFKRKE